MNEEQIPFLVEGVLISISEVFGFFLSRAGKPYSKVKLGFHLFFYTWLSFGYGFISFGYFSRDTMSVIWIPVGIMGLMILIQLATGIIMIARTKVEKLILIIHIISFILMLLSVVCGFVIVGLG